MSKQPYPGLRPFERDDTDVFFGRDQQVDELLEKLQNHHFIAVTGSSGCGKSSLVKAGMLSGLESGFMAQAGAKWAIAVMRPGSDPFRAMSESLLSDEIFHAAWMNDLAIDKDDSKISFLQAELKRGPKSLHEILQATALPEGCKLLLVVDQFEEIFRYQQSETDAASAFISLLLDSITNPNIYVVITMRSDFIGDAARFQNLPEAINDSLYLTPRLSRKQLEETIELPAMVYGGSVEPLLVNHLLNEIGTESDHLPLLEHALMYQWTHDEDHVLTLEEYQKYEGGLKNILNLHLESVYASLNTEQQTIAETLFRALTERTGDNKYIRRPVKLEKIAGLAEVKSDRVIEVVEIFRKEGRNFLMPPVGTELNGDSTLDISHESLIRQWSRLKEWVQDEFLRSEIYRRMISATHRHEKGIGELYRGKDLDAGLECTQHESFNRLWASLNGGHYSQVMQFVEGSRKERGRRKSEEKRTKRIKLYSVASVFLTVIIFAVIGWSLKGRAENAISDMHQSALTATSILSHDEQYQRAGQFITPLINNNASDNNVSTKHSMLILQRVINMQGGKPLKTLWGDKFTTQTMAISPDEKWLIAAGVGGKLAVYNLETDTLKAGSENLKLHEGTSITGVRFLSDSKHFVTIDNGKTIEIEGKKQKQSKLKVWELSSENSPPTLLQELEIKGRTKALDISSEGNIIAVGGTERRIELMYPDKYGKYSHTNRWAIKSRHREGITENGLLFVPHTNQLISSSYDGGVHINIVPSHSEQCSAQYSLDRKGVLAVKLGNEKRFRVPRYALSMALLENMDRSSPELLAVSSGKDISFWNVKTAKRVFANRLEGHQDLIFDLTSFINEEGRAILASASIDKIVRLWDAETGAPLRVLEGHHAAVFSVLYDEKRQRLLSSGSDRELLAWDGQLDYQFKEQFLQNGIASIDINTRFMAIADQKGVLKIYDANKDRALLNEAKTTLTGGVQHVALHPVSHDIVMVGKDESGKSAVELWKYDQNSLVKFTRDIDLSISELKVLDVKFSLDNKWLGLIASDGSVILLDLYRPESEPIKFTAHEQKAQRHSTITFGESSTWFITNNESEIKTWNIQSITSAVRIGEAPTSEFATIEKAGLQNLAINKGNTRIGIVAVKGFIGLYPLNKNTGEIDMQRRKDFLGGSHHVKNIAFCFNGHTLATTALDGLMRIWNIDTQEELVSIPVATGNQSKYIPDLFYTPVKSEGRTQDGCTVTLPMQDNTLLRYDFGHLSDNDKK